MHVQQHQLAESSMHVQQQGQTHVVHYVGKNNDPGCCGVPPEASCAVTGVRDIPVGRRACENERLFGYDYHIEWQCVTACVFEEVGERERQRVRERHAQSRSSRWHCVNCRWYDYGRGGVGFQKLHNRDNRRLCCKG